MADGNDWFSNMFSGGSDTPGGTGFNKYSFDNPDVDLGNASAVNTGGSPRSAEYDLYALFSQGGGGEGSTVTADQVAAAGEGGGPGGGDSVTSFLNKVTSPLATLYEGIKDKAQEWFTTKDTTRTYYDQAKKQMVTENVPGGQINDLGKLLLSGAVTAIGQGAVTKWQEERKEKAAQKERTFKASESEKTRQEARDVQAEKYRRTAYGEAPQVGVTRGILGGG